MTDPRIINLARILVHYSSNVQPGNLVAILGQPPAAPLIREIYREVLRAGGHPYFFDRGNPGSLPGLEGLAEVFLQEAAEIQLSHVDQVLSKVVREFDVYIHVLSSINTRSFSNIDPNRFSIRQRASAEINKIIRERHAAGELKRLITLFPTQAFAQDADMSIAEFEDYVYRTTFADQEDPMAEWMKFHDFQEELIEWLMGKEHVVIQGPHVDLSLSISGRRFLNADGTQNMPSGEIYSSPVEDSANGWIRFTYPVVVRGRECEGIELHFENGQVVKATAEKGEEFLLASLDIDTGARYLGEFAFGTNRYITRFIKNILFDEKIGGTLHLAVGSGFPEVGGKNESAIHWDMICDMREGGQVFVDHELFYDSGEFKFL